MKKIIRNILFLILLLFTFSLPISANAKTYQKKVTLYTGQKMSLSYKGLTVKKAKWKTYNSKIATVSKGVVRAQKAGSTTIRATYKKNTYLFKIKVNSTRKINQSFGTSDYGLETIIVSISPKKVVWRLKNRTDHYKLVKPICFQLDKLIYRLKKTDLVLISPKSFKTFTFIRNKHFENAVLMNCKRVYWGIEEFDMVVWN